MINTIIESLIIEHKKIYCDDESIIGKGVFHCTLPKNHIGKHESKGEHHSIVTWK